MNIFAPSRFFTWNFFVHSHGDSLQVNCNKSNELTSFKWHETCTARNSRTLLMARDPSHEILPTITANFGTFFLFTYIPVFLWMYKKLFYKIHFTTLNGKKFLFSNWKNDVSKLFLYIHKIDLEASSMILSGCWWSQHASVRA